MIDAATGILGIIGYPLEHSFSPRLHNQVLQDLNLNYVYLPLPLLPEELCEGIRAIRTLKIRGVNVTIPYKERVIPLLDELDSLAEEIGAVNTIVNEGGKLKGYNTDCSGFQLMLAADAGFQTRGKKAVIIGAGGAARAVGTALANSGIGKIAVLNRTGSRSEGLVKYWQQLYQGIDIRAGRLMPGEYLPLIREADLLVDTTPVGMSPHSGDEPAVVAEALHSSLLVVDLVYNPRETSLLQAAQDRGAAVLGGLPMLLYQAMESFCLWTGVDPDLEKWRSLGSRFVPANC